MPILKCTYTHDARSGSLQGTDTQVMPYFLSTNGSYPNPPSHPDP